MGYNRLILATKERNAVAHMETLKIVTCPICQAIYTPSAQQATLAQLESAFFTLCRICMRCQRPACPQCWHPLHHLCASCSEKAHLPLRAPVPSLEGRRFFPQLPQQNGQMPSLVFTCLRQGCFYTPEPSHPDQHAAIPASPHTSQLQWPPLPGLLTKRKDAQTEEIWVQDDTLSDELSSFEKIENVLIVVVAALLFAIILMIILALSSAGMNAFFFRLLHLDIHTEILYLLKVG